MDFPSLNEKEILSVLKIAREQSLRDWLLILTTFSHGLRASEACSIRLADIKDGALTVRRLKGSKTTCQQLLSHRGVPLLDEVRGYREWLKIRPSDCGDFVFTSQKGGAISAKHFNYIFKRYARNIGLEQQKQHPHCLKHSIVTALIRNGMDTSYVQNYVGHASIGSTAKYTHLSGSEVTARASNVLITAFQKRPSL